MLFNEFNISEYSDRALAQPCCLFTLYQAKALMIFHYQENEASRIRTLCSFILAGACRYRNQHEEAAWCEQLEKKRSSAQSCVQVIDKISKRRDSAHCRIGLIRLAVLSFGRPDKPVFINSVLQTPLQSMDCGQQFCILSSDEQMGKPK